MNLSFKILSQTTTLDDPFPIRQPNAGPIHAPPPPNDKTFRKKKHNKKKKHPESCSVIPEESKRIENGNAFLPTAVAESVFGNGSTELRQRNVNTGGGAAMEDTVTYSWVEESGTTEESGVTEVSSPRTSESEANGTVAAPKLETVESLDWRKLMAEDPNCKFL